MWAVRGRSKKLRVAFHFLQQAQAGWNCDDCRKASLEKARRCGWLGFTNGSQTSPIWAKHELACFECPRSYVSAQSIAFIEAFSVHKKFGGTAIDVRAAREVEAFLILEGELQEEAKRDARETRRLAEERRLFGR